MEPSDVYMELLDDALSASNRIREESDNFYSIVKEMTSFVVEHAPTLHDSVKVTLSFYFSIFRDLKRHSPLSVHIGEFEDSEFFLKKNIWGTYLFVRYQQMHETVARIQRERILLENLLSVLNEIDIPAMHGTPFYVFMRSRLAYLNSV